MDRSQFLKNLRASRVKLHPVQLEGWEGLVYLRPQTLGEIRDTLLKGVVEETATKQINKDPLYIARSVARLVRDETGALLFDADDDKDMGELMEVLADTGPGISRELNAAYNALNEPNSEEATPEGN